MAKILKEFTFSYLKDGKVVFTKSYECENQESAVKIANSTVKNFPIMYHSWKQIF